MGKTEMSCGTVNGNKWIVVCNVFEPTISDAPNAASCVSEHTKQAIIEVENVHYGRQCTTLAGFVGALLGVSSWLYTLYKNLGAFQISEKTAGHKRQ